MMPAQPNSIAPQPPVIQQACSPASPLARVRISFLIALALLVAIGAALRFCQITSLGQTPDEFWSSVYLATGRGQTVFNLPHDVLLSPPPPTLLQGAPSWPHIWTGLSGITHPPLYLILLRWWMDLFGTGDFSTRAFSALISLAGIVLIFDVVRRLSGPGAALFAAAFMALSPLQIDFSQLARPYPLLAFLALLVCQALVRIEQGGPTPMRLFQFAIALIATALTHYFAFGALVAVTLYVCLRLRGRTRRITLAAIALAGVFTLAVWGPFLLMQHHELSSQQSWSLERTGGHGLPVYHAALVAYTSLYGGLKAQSAWIAPAIIAYLLPPFFFRRLPHLLLWWLWIVGIIGALIVYDYAVHARLLLFFKYTFLASVGFYALFATPLPVRHWWRWTIPGALLAATIGAAVARIQQGSSVQDDGDWRALALKIDHLARPGDPLVFYPDPFWGPSAMFYLDFAHYVKNSPRPVMFLSTPASPIALAQLKAFHQIWLVGPAPSADAARFLPGWKPVSGIGFIGAGGIAKLFPTTSPPPP